jgi:hypothetical protein
MSLQKKYAFNVDRIETELPMFIEKVGKRWVEYGADNLFPQFIAGLFNKSAMNRTAIQSKLDGVVGQGLKTKKEEDNYLLKRANPKESYNDVFEKATLDYITFGGFALNIIWSNDGETIAEIYHLDFSRVRSGVHSQLTNEVDKYYYAADWSQWRKIKPLEFSGFDPEKSIDCPSQVFYFFDYEPGSLFYPLPSYSGGLNDIQIDVEVSKFHINNLANGLAPSLFIGLNNGIPDPEARQEIYDEITMAFRGSDNAGKAFIAFSDDKEHAPDILPIPAANSDYYVNLETRITSRILSAHRITSPMLLGLYHEGGTGLGSNKDEIETAYSHFITTVVKPIQKSMLKVFDSIMFYRGYVDVELYIEPNKMIEATENTIATE